MPKFRDDQLAHPATALEYAYTPQECEFLQAIDIYKRNQHRPFPTWREVLAVLVALGYRQVEPRGPLPKFERHPGNLTGRRKI